MVDLRNRGIITKVRTLKTGQTVGGIPFTRGPLVGAAMMIAAVNFRNRPCARSGLSMHGPLT